MHPPKTVLVLGSPQPISAAAALLAHVGAKGYEIGHHKITRRVIANGAIPLIPLELNTSKLESKIGILMEVFDRGANALPRSTPILFGILNTRERRYADALDGVLIRNKTARSKFRVSHRWMTPVDLWDAAEMSGHARLVFASGTVGEVLQAALETIPGGIVIEFVEELAPIGRLTPVFSRYLGQVATLIRGGIPLTQMFPYTGVALARTEATREERAVLISRGLRLDPTVGIADFSIAAFRLATATRIGSEAQDRVLCVLGVEVRDSKG